MTDSYLR